MNKTQILFHLNRTLRGLEEEASFDHEGAAKKGMPYHERMALMELGTKRKPEAEALQATILFVQSTMPEEKRTEEQHATS